MAHFYQINRASNWHCYNRAMPIKMNQNETFQNDINDSCHEAVVALKMFGTVLMGLGAIDSFVG